MPACITSKVWYGHPFPPSLGSQTYIKVIGRHPGDADGLSLAALHRTPGGLDGEALVLKQWHTVQAELHGL